MLHFVVIGQEKTDKKQTKKSEIDPNTCGNVVYNKSDISNQWGKCGLLDKCHLELLPFEEKNKATPLLAKINSR